ncbi:hypothetical protein PHJA_001099500 [Phtheirospermum japonicum]|uniref:DUF295 domain-containing protein n=1 Tax=Phtheirospermum japonicum TaxID=374723 RepID=A0A830BTZ2_9LAMI|nr:hypothetical protein PHJA_001099500 [Phtheirospermum japonicum]
MFIGMNHSFAVAGAFLGLKPDSIYFTDEPSFIFPKICETDFGGHDIGVFNYYDTTFFSCY